MGEEKCPLSFKRSRKLLRWEGRDGEEHPRAEAQHVGGHTDVRGGSGRRTANSSQRLEIVCKAGRAAE